MLKVFKIKSDFAFQSFLPYAPNDPQPETVEAEILTGRTSPRLTMWTPVHLYEHEPIAKRGSFGRLWGFGGHVINEYARTLLLPILEDSCEFLPFLPLDVDHYFRLIVLERVDCLDREKSVFDLEPNTGLQGPEILEYHFQSPRLTHPNLFLLPHGSALFTVQGLRDPGQEFKGIVEREGLTGLKFQEVWSESGTPIRNKSFFEKYSA